jgi:hypothetical protein
LARSSHVRQFWRGGFGVGQYLRVIGKDVYQRIRPSDFQARPSAFFVAVFPQFILPGSGVAGQVLILGVTSICVEFVTLILYGLLAAQVGKFAIGARFVALANRLSGLMLILAAVALARSRL